MEEFISFLEDPIFRAACFSWLLSQFLKSVIEIFKKKPHSAKELLISLFWATGGMPSSHSAVVSSICTSVGFRMGVTSPVFMVTLFYAFITIRDALGVRRAAGAQAKVINQLIDSLDGKIDSAIKPVKEIHGHRGPEVLVGIVLGFFLAVAFNSL
ncbi:MAG: divergent PAP2 family protein [Spirochaetales bacterium]|nr:divergent PAP2 family protein [Spirochaetales bacterium]